MTARSRARAEQDMPTNDEALGAYRQGQLSRPGTGNPYAGQRVLGSVWAAGNREATRIVYREWRRREAARRENDAP